MYCVRCGSPLSGGDVACAQCGADLTAAGAVRLTDPAVEAEVAAANQAESDRIEAERAAAEAEHAEALRSPIVDPWAIGTSGATAKQGGADHELAASSQDSLQPSQLVEAASDTPETKTDSEQVDRTVADRAARSRHLARVLGVDLARPTGKTLAALLVLFGALVLMLLLMAGFMNLDRVIFGKSAPASTIYVTATADPTSQPS